MYKKLIAMILACTMLVSISPAVAAENASAKPTIEDILNEYHQAAIGTQNTGEADTAATYSPRSAHGSKTLEQETVDTLNAAGYEAYNVTPANYSVLENQLSTDFADMGLEPEGSYIIVIHGDDSDNSNTANRISPRAVVLPPIEDHIGRTSFDYTYNGKTYTMRYVTVTPTENSNLHQVLKDPVQLLEGYSDEEKLMALNFSLSVMSLVPEVSTFATILSLLMSVLPHAEITQPESLTYTPISIWNITYTQVYDSQYQEWQRSTGVEYVRPKYVLNYYYYDPSISDSAHRSVEGFLPNIYSEHYNDTEYMKQIAAQAFEYNTCSMDAIDKVIFKYNGNVVARHDRWWEPANYEPA